MAKAKLDKIANLEKKESFTHKNFQKRKAGRPSGSTTKKEQSNASLTIVLTPSQKTQLEAYS